MSPLIGVLAGGVNAGFGRLREDPTVTGFLPPVGNGYRKCYVTVPGLVSFVRPWVPSTLTTSHTNLCPR